MCFMQVSCQYGHIHMTGTRHMIFFGWDERKSCTNSFSHQAKVQSKILHYSILETCRKFTLRMLWICQFLLEVTDFAFAETPQEPEMKIQVIFHLLLHVFTDQMLDGRSSLGGKQADIQNWKRERSSWQLKRHCLRKQWQSYQRLRIYCCLYLLVTLFHPLFY